MFQATRPSATHNRKPESLWQVIREALQLTGGLKNFFTHSFL